MHKKVNPSYRPLKRRNFKSCKSLVNSLNFWQKIHWAKAGLLSMGCGSMSINLIKRLLSHTKKVLRWPKHMSRSWVNIPRRHILTRKPINTRMGKGKGSKAGVCARLRGGALLIAYADIRKAQQARLHRWLRVRVPFATIAYNSATSHSLPARVSWVRYWRLQTKYVNQLIDDLDNRLTEIHRPGLFIYYMGILNWRWHSPKGGFMRAPWVRFSRPVRRMRRRAIKHALRRKSWRNYAEQHRLAVLRLGKEFSRRLAWVSVTTRNSTKAAQLLFKPIEKG